MKRKIFICALIGIVISIAAFGTTAFFAYEDTASNVITAGNVKVALVEAVDGQEAPYTDTLAVMPGTVVIKNAAIKNIGKGTAWIRVSVDKAIELAAGVAGEPDVSLVEVDFNTDDWQLQNGYYYYRQPLKASEITAPLFTEITFSKQIRNQYQNSKAVVRLRVEATQQKNNGNTVFDAVGWPQQSP